jgi:2-haloacid dehalogenase
MATPTCRLCLFDAYGTLFNLDTVIEQSAAQLGDLASPLLRLWRQKQLEYTWLRTLMRQHAPFDRVTADALDYALRVLGISDPGLASSLLASFERVAPFPDVSAAVATLDRAGIRNGVLSNGTPAMLASALHASGLESAFRFVLSVETVRCYKPDPRVYAMASSETHINIEEIVFVSSNAWDVSGAASFGLRVVWLNRNAAWPEPLPGTPAAIISSLSEAAEIIAGGSRAA